MFEYIWILLPLGLIIGWYAAKLDSSRKRKLHQYLNLRYYLDKEKVKTPVSTPDSAIPLNVEDEGIHFTLTLGDAYRRRGEVDKAIEMHEHLLHSLDINDAKRAEVLISLSEDYVHAGIFDRSERTLRELLSTPYHDEAALKLAALYKQQNDWLQAASMYERINDYKTRYTTEVAHLYCEIAEQALTDHDLEQALFWSARALSVDENLARASLINAYIALTHQEFHKVIDALTLLSEQQPSLTPIIVPIMYRAMMNVEPQRFAPWLDEMIEHYPHYFYLKLWKTHLCVLTDSLKTAIDYLTEQLTHTKNLQGITLLNRLNSLQDGEHQATFTLYHETFHHVIDYYAQFRCEKCGFISKTLQWHCPSCQSWNTAAPVSDIIALQK
ncbi:tetratricopeptide repeat protein [Wohlfahrtiimonas chitiniclastica]|uniref:LapB rubredoxin metal binding domain-containing protein n=2 Tax=Wohlfahrtiimonas chitiniclastica TaxID=400946 RepID=L8XTD7_9GAMM|nr:tetratricopeptide repeat protein [Wohlfahrtiimonas chitiniclastica]ELV07298.1 Hypothetical protein F387_01848 [Wohlfahrtiimonas chitiniclastica SH04]MBS7816653.1 tetratricopeptide repeat protein [Wohlfahrtiimonas chitiniclastica]MBS7823555.1 tetratricopeptide repeat protein [Wohlfahrtiimonas chitiniclastica]MBS7825388.1 tetratricopeptide repeat protein [Wohlfahrtiimonas chitiniclastica]MBS7829389.1 tetratricopeptide repeat protein [Wohlfahrtiimonas chitiniclastica]